MKRFFFLFVGFLSLFQSLHAQFNERPIPNLENKDKKFINFAYYLGLNQYDFKFDYKENTGDVLVSKSLGFTVGLVAEARINEFFDVRFEPGLAFTSRTLGFPGFTEGQENDAIREVKSTYINFPILLKASTRRLGNWRPFIVGGVSASLNLGSNEDSLDDNSSGTFRMKKTLYNYELGFGIDFYLEYFKFSPSIRGVFAISDELIRDNDPNSPWTGNIDAMSTRGLFINFTFE